MSDTVELISKAIKSPSVFLEAKKCGVTEQLFVDPEEIAVWAVIESHFQRHANVPPYDLITKLVPTFVFAGESTSTISELVERVNNNHTEIEIRKAWNDIEGMLSLGDFVGAIGRMHQGANAANRKSGLSKDVSMSSRAEALYYRYIDYKSGGMFRGIPWPWAPLTAETGGITPSTYNILYGRLKSTKTWRILEAVIAAHEAGKKPLLVSCEMDVDDILQRAACIYCALDYTKLKKGQLSEEEEARLRNYYMAQKNLPPERHLMVTRLADNSSNRTPEALHAKIDEYEPDVVFIDAIYKMIDSETGMRGDIDVKAMRNISNNIQLLGQTTKRPFVVTTQANRKGQKAVHGDATDVGFADALGQDCDLLLRLVNDKKKGRTVFLVQAAREIDFDGFSVMNKCCESFGPYIRPDGVADWSLPLEYIQQDEGEGGSKPSKYGDTSARKVDERFGHSK